MSNRFQFTIQYPLAVSLVINVIIAMIAQRIEYISTVLLMFAVCEQLYYYARKMHLFAAHVTLVGNEQSAPTATVQEETTNANG